LDGKELSVYITLLRMTARRRMSRDFIRGSVDIIDDVRVSQGGRLGDSMYRSFPRAFFVPF
jgi:hypothetical protein